MFCNFCGKDNPDSSNFCSQCGSKIIKDYLCPGCGTKSLPGANFCHICGYKVNPNATPVPPQLPYYGPQYQQQYAQGQAPFQQAYQAPPQQGGQFQQQSQTQTPPPVQAPNVERQTYSSETTQAEYAQQETSPSVAAQTALQEKKKPEDQNTEENEQSGNQGDAKSAIRSELGKYLPEHIVKQIMQKGTMEEEMKNVTVIFADISGFTSMSENMDPEEVTALMNECFQFLVHMVDKYGGMVNKFIGDCVMAIFGAPVAHENDPERAVRCTLGMLRGLEEFNKKKKLEKPLGISIGVNSGKVFAGIVGSAMRKEYTVMGDTVNLAQRLESAAARGQVLVGNNVYKATRDLFEFHELDPIAVKGKKDKVKCYSVEGEKKEEKINVDYRWDFINRRAEIEKLLELKEKALSSKGQVSYIVGEAGVGKSRLIGEFFDSLEKEDSEFRIFRAQCLSHSMEISYYPVTIILRTFLKFEDSDDEEALKKKVEVLKGWGLDKNEIHFIGSLFSLKYADSNIQFFDEAKKKISTFIALKSLFQKISRVKPTIICIDNLQWIDPLSKEFLVFLTEDIEHEKLLALFAARQKTLGDLGVETNQTIISIDPFDKDKLYELVEAILGSKNVNRRIKTLLWERSGGNPLFAEEIIKSFVEDKKIIETEEGCWELKMSVEEESEIPQNIHSLIASRIDRLPDTAKKLLQHLSVIGREFKYGLLNVFLPDYQNLDKNIQILKERDILMIVSTSPELIYSFKSLLLVEVGYSSILKKNIKILHKQCGFAIEKLYKDRLAENFELLCHHFQKTDDEEKAVYYLEKAANKLQNDFQLEGASEYYYTLINRIKDGIEKEILDPVTYKEKLLEIYLKFGQTSVQKGDLHRAQEIYEALKELALSLGNNESLAEAMLGVSNCSFLAGEWEKAISTLNETLKLTEETDLKHYSVQCKKQLGQIYERLGNPEKAEKHLEEALKISEDMENMKQTGEINRVLGTSSLFTGEYDKALECYDKALIIAKELSDKATILSVLGNIGIVYSFQKDYDNSLDYYNQSLRIAREVGDKIGVSRNLHNIGELYYEREMYTEALSSFEQSLPISQETGWKEGTAQNLIYVGFLKFIIESEDSTKGREIINDGINLSKKCNFNRSLPMGLYYLGITYSKEGNKEKANDYFARGLEIAESTGFKKLIEDINLELKKLE
ncbi:MAG: tetratricopeptide repeat protein [Pseudomonadota bacterium]